MTRPDAAQFPQSLDGIGIFAGLSSEARANLKKRCGWRRYEAGEPIVDHLDKSDDVYFITAGNARASLYSVSGKAVTFTDLGPGDMFGEIAAIDGGTRSASIEAKSGCIVAAMPSAVFRDVLRTEPAATEALLHLLASRIRVLTTRVYEFSALAVNNRIQAEVLRLAAMNARNGNSAHIDAAPTHAEIASRVTTHREAVTREFNRLSRLGIIEQHGRALVVKDVARLSEMVHDATGE
jgi:CRP-like cAMP-binding protein